MPTATQLPTGSATASGTWTNGATGLNADDGTHANFTTTTKNDVRSLTVGTFGFDSAIPAGATIDAVAIEVQEQVTSGGTLRTVIRVGGVDGDLNDNTTDTSLTVRTYSNLARPGGGSWTRADLLNGTLTVRFEGRQPNNTTSRTYQADYVKVIVDYSTGTTHQGTASGASTSDGSANATIVPPPTLTYDFNGGTNGNTIATTDTGSGDPFQVITLPAGSAAIYDNAHARGTLAGKVTCGAATSLALRWNTNIGTRTTVWHRAYLYLESAIAQNTRIVRVFDGATFKGAIVLLNAATGRTIRLVNAAGGTITATTTQYPLNEWFRIEAKFVAAGASGSIELRLFTGANVDGTTPDETISGTADVGTQYTIYDPVCLSTVNVGPIWADDVGFSAADWLGPTGTGAVTHQGSASGASSSTGSAAATITSGAVTHQASASGASTSTGSAAARLRLRATASGASTSAGSAAARLRLRASSSGASTSSGTAAARLRLRASASGTSSSSGTASGNIAGNPVTWQAAASGTSTSVGSAAAVIIGGAVTHLATAAGLSQSAGEAAARLIMRLVASGASFSSGEILTGQGPLVLSGSGPYPGGPPTGVVLIVAHRGAQAGGSPSGDPLVVSGKGPGP